MLINKMTINNKILKLLRGSAILLRSITQTHKHYNMPITKQFPNGGYDVTVCRKQDILDCLDANIVDKDVVLAVISQCELDANNFIREGRWTGIPFLGNIRVPKRTQKLQSKEVQELIEEARNTLDRDKYYVFRKNLNVDLDREEKRERFFKYLVSSFANRNRRFYNKQVEKRGELGAQFLCYTLINISIGAPREDF